MLYGVAFDSTNWQSKRLNPCMEVQQTYTRYIITVTCKAALNQVQLLWHVFRETPIPLSRPLSENSRPLKKRILAGYILL
jgi:hypothetical protein